MKLFVNLFKSRYLKSLGITSEYNYDTKVDVLVIGSDEVFNCFQSKEHTLHVKRLQSI